MFGAGTWRGIKKEEVMALFQISNDKITIQVDSLGAELKSLKLSLIHI